MQRYLKIGDIFCFVYDDNRFCFGRIIGIRPKRFCVAEIFDFSSETPVIDEKTIEKAGRIIPPVNINSYILFDCKSMGGDWRIIGHQEDYTAPDYDELFIGWGLEDNRKKEDMRGNMTETSEEEYGKCLSHVPVTDLTVKELLKDFYGERQVRKSVDDIRKTIGIVKYGMEEYLKAVDEVPGFDINSLDKNKQNLLQCAILNKKWDIAKDLIKRGIDVNNQDIKMRTPLHYICARPNDVELAAEILKAGGDPNIRDKENRSPLYELTSMMRNDLRENKYQIMRLLLDHGGDPVLPCRDGRSAGDVAKETGDKTALELFEQYGRR